jgi:hypothetical protein
MLLIKKSHEYDKLKKKHKKDKVLTKQIYFLI